MDDEEPLRATTVVALRLGELVEDTRDELVALMGEPIWRRSRARIARIVGSLDTGVEFFGYWREAFPESVNERWPHPGGYRSGANQPQEG